MGTSHTPSTEFAYGLLFTCKFTEDGLQLDWVYNLEGVLGNTWQGILAAEKLTGIRNSALAWLPVALRSIDLRCRLDGAVRGPYLIKTKEALSSDNLEKSLNALPPDERNALLESAEI